MKLWPSSHRVWSGSAASKADDGSEVEADIANTSFGPGSEFGFQISLTILQLTEATSANRTHTCSAYVRFRKHTRELVENLFIFLWFTEAGLSSPYSS